MMGGQVLIVDNVRLLRFYCTYFTYICGVQTLTVYVFQHSDKREFTVYCFLATQFLLVIHFLLVSTFCNTYVHAYVHPCTLFIRRSKDTLCMYCVYVLCICMYFVLHALYIVTICCVLYVYYMYIRMYMYCTSYKCSFRFIMATRTYACVYTCTYVCTVCAYVHAYVYLPGGVTLQCLFILYRDKTTLR